MDKAAKRLAVIYVILLSLCAPLMAVHFELFTWFMGVVDMSYWTQTVLWFLPMLVYGGILVVLGIWNVVKSFMLTFGLVMGTRGLALLGAPVWLPFVLVMIGWSVIMSWLAILPGSIYSIQVIRGSVRTGKISGGAAVLHGILQFLFLADVLDAMYLAAGKWGRGKKSSVLVGLVYIAAVVGIVWIVYKLKN